MWKQSEDPIIRGILIRAMYHGMEGDIKMLGYFAKNWQKRF